MSGWFTPYIQIPDISEAGYSTPDNYRVTIFSDKGETIVANIPEQINISIGAEWSQPFSRPLSERLADSGMLGKAGGKILSRANVAAAASGVSTQNKYLSVCVWSQGNNMTLSLPLVFRAFNDPIKDVTDKVVRLLTMCTPGESGGMLTAPGPTIGSEMGVTALGETITVKLGNFISLSPVIITQVSSDIPTQYDARGNPMSATVNVDIQMPWVTTKDDIIKFFVQNSYKSGAKSLGVGGKYGT